MGFFCFYGRPRGCLEISGKILAKTAFPVLISAAVFHDSCQAFPFQRGGPACQRRVNSHSFRTAGFTKSAMTCMGPILWLSQSANDLYNTSSISLDLQWHQLRRSETRNTSLMGGVSSLELFFYRLRTLASTDIGRPTQNVVMTLFYSEKTIETMLRYCRWQ